MQDTIHINGIRLSCRVGVPAWERRKRQPISVDLVIEADLLKVGLSDDLRDAVDYQEVERRARAAAEGTSFKLLERLAEEVAQAALSTDRRIGAVRVRASKKPTLMPKVREAAVEIRRARP